MTKRISLTKSKILCTLGPASDSPEMIEKLAATGMDCARINFSHGTDEYKSDLFNRIRETDDTIAILCDIQGPKIRIGMIQEGGVILKTGNTLIMTSEEIVGDDQRISVLYRELPREAEKGDLIYINDGIVCVRIENIEGSEMECKILSGGNISSRKGVNLPSTEISLTVPTPKDTHDLELIAKLDPEFVAVSFVGNAGDVVKIRKMLSDFGNDTIKLISKIERPVALENFDSILEVSDGIMVARGDLGVEIPPEEVLPAQKEMIRKCNIAGKPIIVATQMLESMVKSPVPTRAEVSDVFNAIEDGADAVMLSAETASGNFPIEAVAIMEKVIRKSESLMPPRDPDEFDSDRESITEIIGHLVYSACKEFADMRYEKGRIICLTQSSHTAKMVSKYRPFLPILGITSDLRVAREMRLVWGVEPVVMEEMADSKRTLVRIKRALEVCLRNDYIAKRDKLIITGNLYNLPLRTNMVSIVTAEDVLEMA